MSSFLITFKPATENRELGWPLEELQALVRRHRAGEVVEEKWRFHNRKGVSLGNRVYLLLQGKSGPAVIGYGRVVGQAQNDEGKWQVPIQFGSIVDPTTEVLLDREDLLAIDGAQSVWRSQVSGIQIPELVAHEVEALVAGRPPKLKNKVTISNPDWARDELILALNLYLKHRFNPPGKDSQQILELSKLLNQLGEKLFSPETRSPTFRNASGVYMKLMNFRRFDSLHIAEGRAGLSRGARAEEEVWAEFAEDPTRCQQVTDAIIASIRDPEVSAAWLEPDVAEGIQEAPEGRLLTRKHFVRERCHDLVTSKRNQAMKRYGRLASEACEFDFAVHYGDRGIGFMECHHIKPIATLTEGHQTHLDDLALLCANCHRMIHRERPWLSVAQLRSLLDGARAMHHTGPLGVR